MCADFLKRDCKHLQKRATIIVFWCVPKQKWVYSSPAIVISILIRLSWIFPSSSVWRFSSAHLTKFYYIEIILS